MKILITGGSGFLGSRLCHHLASSHEVVAPTHQEMDITDADATKQFIGALRPEVVIHCAAISSTAYAQQHPHESQTINVEGTRNIAVACRECGAKMLFMSSDQVYGGVTTQGLLPEDTPLAPTGVYGQQKLEAERIIAELLPTSVSLRLTWMYDRQPSDMPFNSSIFTALNNAKITGQPIRACTREFRGITNVWAVVSMIEVAIQRDLPGGVYNFGCENNYNSYETYRHLAKLADVPLSLIVPDDSWQRNLSMSTAKIKQYNLSFGSTII